MPDDRSGHGPRQEGDPTARPDPHELRPRRARRVQAAVAAVALLAALGAVALHRGLGWTAAPSTSAAPTPPTVSLLARPADVAGSVAYLQQHYGVSQAEAMRRLNLQLRAPSLAAWLERRFPDSFAGMWLDQDHGGVLMIGATRPEPIRAAVATLPERAFIRVVPARSTLRALRAVAAGVQARFDLRRGTAAVVDEPHNLVVVYTSPEQLEAVRAGVAQLGVDPGVVTVQARPKLTPD
jgi:streptogrisin C